MPAACRVRLEAADPVVYDQYATPALSGEHGIRYDTVDLAGDHGPPWQMTASCDRPRRRTSPPAEAFRAEAERIARERAARHPQASTQCGEA